MGKTKIEYLDFSWNPIAMRCTPVSEGCTNCWHQRMANRLAGNEIFPEEVRKAYAGEGPPVLIEKRLNEPLRRKMPTRFGVQFMGDLFHESVPDNFIARVFTIMGDASQHTYQILTKRPGRMKELFSRKTWHDDYLGLYQTERENWWFGVSVENQAAADERIPILLQTPAAVRFINAEPLLSGIDISPYLGYDTHSEGNQDNGGMNYGKRGNSLRTGQGWKMENRPIRSGVGTKGKGIGQERSSHPTGLHTSQEDAKRHSSLHWSTSVNMETPQRPNTRRYDDTSQEWNQRRQQVGELGSCHAIKEYQQCILNGLKEPMGRNKPECKVDGYADCGNQEDLCLWGHYARGASTKIQSGISDNIEDSKGRKAPGTGRPSGRLHTQETASKSETKPKGSIHLVIVGGESGPGARPMEPQWARDIRDQCRAASVPFFMKQMSKRGPIPEDLMIREYPNANT